MDHNDLDDSALVDSLYSKQPPDDNNSQLQKDMELLDSLYPNRGDESGSNEVSKSSTLGAVGRAAVESVGPGAAAAAAFTPAMGAAAPFAAFTGPAAPLVELGAGVIGSALAAGAAGFAQHKAAQLIAPEATEKWDAQRSTDESEHPVASAVGRIAASLPMFELNPLQSVRGVSALYKAARSGGKALSKEELEAAKATAAQVGLGTGTAVIQPYVTGHSPTAQGVAEAFVQSLLLGSPRYELFGKHVESQVAKEETASDRAKLDADAKNPASTVYGATAPLPSLTPDERGKLAALAGKVAANAPMTPTDVGIHAQFLNGDNPDAEAFFNTWKNIWTHSIAATLAKKADIHNLNENDLTGQKSSNSSQIPPSVVPAPAAEGDPLSLDAIQTPPVTDVLSGTGGSNTADLAGAVDEKNERTDTAPAQPAPVAQQIAEERPKIDTAPTEAQKEAGNYAKGHVSIDGMNVAIENPKGSMRRGVGVDGKPWEVEMPGDYGYIKGTEGKDGDHVDVTIGPNPDGAKKVWVIDQKKADGSFDELKSLLGYDSMEQALAAYRASFSDGKADQRIGGVTEMSREQFKEWVTKGDTKKPLIGQKAPVPDWQKAQGNMQVLARFQNALETGQGQLVAQERGAGKKGGALFDEPVAGEKPDDFLARLDTTAKNKDGKNYVDRTLSPTLVAMQAPDGSHVRISTFYRNNGKEYVSTVEGKGENIASQLDKGWKLVGAMKGEPTKHHVETYSHDQWQGIASDMRTALSGAKATAAKMEANLEAAREFGRENTEATIPEGAHVPLEDKGVSGDEEAAGTEAAAEVGEQRDFGKDTADAIATAFDGVSADRLKSPAEIVLRLKSAGPEAVEAFKVMVRNAVDLGADPHAAVEYSNQKIYEAQTGSKNAGESARKLEESFLQGANQPSNQGFGVGQSAQSVSSDNSGGATPTSDQRRPGGTEAGANAHGQSGATGAAKSNTEPAAKPNTPRVELARKPALNGKELQTLEAIAERVAGEQGHGSQEDIEAAVEQMLDAGVPVRVDGKLGLFLDDGQIHMAKGSMAPPPEFVAAASKFRTAQAKEAVAAIRQTPGDRANILNAAIDNLRNVGVVVKAIVDPLAGHFSTGEYKGWFPSGRRGAEQVIEIHIADIAHPTAENLVALFHEAGHAVFDNLTPELQAALHTAVKKFTNDELGIGRYEEAVAHLPTEQQPFVAQEGRLVESLAQKLAAEGFNPTESPGMAAKIWRTIKNIARGVYMAFQKMAGYPISERRAMDFFEYRVRQALRGEAPMRLLDFLGGPRRKLPDWDDARVADGLAARQLPKYRGIDPLTNPRKYLDTREGAPVGIAALNHFWDTVVRQAADWNLKGNIRGLTQEQIITQLMKMPAEIDGSPLFQPGVGPQQLVEAASKMHGVSPDTRFADLPNDVALQRAMVMTHRMLSEWQVIMDAHAATARREMRSDGAVLERNDRELTRLTKTYQDVDAIAATAREQMMALIDEMRNTLSGIRDVAWRGGSLEQVMRQLEGVPEGGEIPISTRKAINELHDYLVNSDEGIKFADRLQAIASLDLDWQGVSTKDMAELLRQVYVGSKDPNLEGLFHDTPRSRALLAVTIAYAKSNAHVMDLLATRLEKNKNDIAQVNTFVKDLLTSGRQNLSEIRDRVDKIFSGQKLRVRMARIAQRIEEIKAKNYDLLDAVAKNRNIADFHKNTFAPDVAEQLGKIEAKTGISIHRFEVTHDAKVPVPNDKGEIEYKPLKLKLDAGKRGDIPTTNRETESWCQAMQRWLDNPDNKARGARYNEVQEALTALRDHYVSTEHANIRNNFVLAWFAPIQERCFKVGTAASRLMGIAFKKYTAHIIATRGEVNQRGGDFEAAAANASRLAGYKDASWRTWFDRRMAPVLHDLEQNGERIWANAKSVDEMVGRALAHTINRMDADQPFKSAAERRAAEKVLEIAIRNNDYLVSQGAKNGLKVFDPYREREEKDKISGKVTKTQSGIYRPVLGKSPFVWPRALRSEADDFYRTHMLAKWGGDPIDVKKAIELYKQGPDALRGAVADRFTPEVWGYFVRSLAYNDKSHFYAPNEGDIKPLADRDNVISAYNMAGGDVVKFAEQLALLHGYKPDAEYVADTLHTIQQFANLLRTMAGDEQAQINRGVPTPARFIVDARHIEAAPKEWLEYLPPDRHNMTRVAHSQAFQIAFGRNGDSMNKLMLAAVNEQRDAAQAYKVRYDAIKGEHPEWKDKQVQAALKDVSEAQGFNYDMLHGARENLGSINDVQEAYDSLKKANRGGSVFELRPWVSLLRAIGGWTVSGLGTAITAHSVFLEQPVRLGGLSGRTLAMTGRSLVDLGRVMANSMLQAFGRQAYFDADRIALANRLGFVDAITPNKDRLVVAANQARELYAGSGWLGRTAGKVGNLAQAVLQTDVFAPGAREKAIARQAAGEAAAPTLKVLSPFHWVAESLKYSNFITWMRHYEGMVLAGVRHFDANPELINDPDYRFDRKTIADAGFAAGDREFGMLRQQMANYGLDFESMVREAYRNKGAGKQVLSDKAAAAIQQLVLDEITLESSLTSRHPFLQTTGLGVAMNPFLGWPLQKTYQVFRQLREPSGEATAKALRYGLTAYMAILPIGMVVAWLRNKFDEDVLGRKQNISDIGNIHDAHSAMMTALDNASRVGTFGMVGEFANYFLSDDNVRPVTVDNRVFFINTLENVFNAGRALYHQTAPALARGDIDSAAGTATDYQTVLRPLAQSLGGNGLLQNLGAVNHLLSLDDAEAWVANRISVNNYLRVAGRELDMDVRTFGGMMQASISPNPLKPIVGRMVLSAYANDAQGFNQAYRAAIKEAMANDHTINRDEATKKIAAMYSGQNPLRIVFAHSITPSEFHKLISQLPDSGKASVQQSLNLFEHFGAQIGAHTDALAKEKSSQMLPKLTLDMMRQNALNHGHVL